MAQKKRDPEALARYMACAWEASERGVQLHYASLNFMPDEAPVWWRELATVLLRREEDARREALEEGVAEAISRTERGS